MEGAAVPLSCDVTEGPRQSLELEFRSPVARPVCALTPLRERWRGFCHRGLLALVLVACLGTLLGLAVVEEGSFAVPRALSAASRAECDASCRATAGALCDGQCTRTVLCELLSCKKRQAQQCRDEFIPTFIPRWCDPTASDAECVDHAPDTEAVGKMLNRSRCEFKVMPSRWQPYVATVTLLFVVAFVIWGQQPEVMLLGACCFYSLIGITTVQESFHGFASEAVVGLFVLFPIGAAVEETGMVDKVFNVMLGNPRSFGVALFRMMVPVALLSALLSNTAIVVMMIPILISWSRRLDIPAGKLLMPLSFAAQLGGTCTLIGSSCCLVAKVAVEKGGGKYKMAMFDLSLPGITVALGGFLAMYLSMPLLKSSAVGARGDGDRVSVNAIDVECGRDVGFQPDLSSGRIVEVGANTSADVEVNDVIDTVDGQPFSEAIWRSLAIPTSGGSLRRVAKVRLKRMRTPWNRLYTLKTVVREYSAFVGADADEKCQQLARLPGVTFVAGPRKEDGQNLQVLSPGARLQCYCTAEGVVNIRQVHDLRLSTEADLVLLGAHRRRRCLFETMVHPGSALIGKRIDQSIMRDVYACCVLGIRGKQGAYATIRVGDVLLIEAAPSASSAWRDVFALAERVPNSQPPRFGGVHDWRRAMLVSAGMCLLILLVAVEAVNLSYGGGLLVCFFILIRARSLEQVYGSIKAPVLLTIAGAFGASSALENTGVASFLAELIAGGAGSLGAHGVRATVYCVAAGLSMFINNSATVAVVGPMMAGVARKAEISEASLVWTMVFGAGCCFTTPLGYQTNVMVMAEGEYSFIDFTRYGLPVQGIHFLLTLASVWLWSDVFGFLSRT